MVYLWFQHCNLPYRHQLLTVTEETFLFKRKLKYHKINKYLCWRAHFKAKNIFFQTANANSSRLVLQSLFFFSVRLQQLDLLPQGPGSLQKAVICATAIFISSSIHDYHTISLAMQNKNESFLMHLYPGSTKYLQLLHIFETESMAYVGWLGNRSEICDITWSLTGSDSPSWNIKFVPHWYSVLHSARNWF